MFKTPYSYRKETMDMNMELDKDILKAITDQVATKKLSAADMEGLLHQMHKQMLEAALEGGVCQASCPISYAANTTFLSNSLLSFDGFSQTSLTGFQLRTERFFQRSGLASLAVS